MYLLGNDAILYIENPLKNIDEKWVNHCCRCKVNIQKSLVFLYNRDEQTKKKTKKINPFTDHHKNKIPRNKVKKCKTNTLQTMNIVLKITKELNKNMWHVKVMLMKNINIPKFIIGSSQFPSKCPGLLNGQASPQIYTVVQCT